MKKYWQILTENLKGKAVIVNDQADISFCGKSTYIKEEVIEAATNEARKEVMKLLGGVISGMNVGQPVIPSCFHWGTGPWLPL